MLVNLAASEFTDASAIHSLPCCVGFCLVVWHFGGGCVYLIILTDLTSVCYSAVGGGEFRWGRRLSGWVIHFQRKLFFSLHTHWTQGQSLLFLVQVIGSKCFFYWAEIIAGFTTAYMKESHLCGEHWCFWSLNGEERGLGLCVFAQHWISRGVSFC